MAGLLEKTRIAYLIIWIYLKTEVSDYTTVAVPT